MEFRADPDDHGRRLDDVLARRFPQLSRMHLRRLLDAGGVTVGATPAPAGWRLREGDAVAVVGDLAATSAMTPEALPLRVWLEDEHLAVVEKPAGMVVHPAGRHRSGTLANALAHHFNVAGGADPPIRPGLTHRLDRATSGLMVVAKTQTALSRLTVQFQQRRVRKLYLALLLGCPTQPEGEWDAPIGADAAATPRWGVRPEGRPARSRYRTLEAVERAGEVWSLVELEPLTGRTNQLRLHSAHFSHPIAGDELFGRGREPELGRLFLHAHRLEFRHPHTGVPVAVTSPLPEALDDWLREGRRYSGRE